MPRLSTRVATALALLCVGVPAHGGEEPTHVREYRKALPGLRSALRIEPSVEARVGAAYELGRRKWELSSLEGCGLRVESLREALRSDASCAVRLMAAWSLASLGRAEGADLLRAHLREPLCEIPADRRRMFERDFVEGLLENRPELPCDSTPAAERGEPASARR